MCFVNAVVGVWLLFVTLFGFVVWYLVCLITIRLLGGRFGCCFCLAVCCDVVVAGCCGCICILLVYVVKFGVWVGVIA